MQRFQLHLSKILLGEILQICLGTETPPLRKSSVCCINLRYKVGKWFDDFWNKCDLALFVLFVISISLRCTLINQSPCDRIDNRIEYHIIATRVSYCLFFIMANLRCLHFFYISENLGPIIVMAIGMATDLMWFLLIMAFLIVSFGVTYTAFTNPNSEFNFELVSKSLGYSSYQMFGELSLDKLIDDDDDCDEPASPQNMSLFCRNYSIVSANDTTIRDHLPVVNRWIIRLFMFVYILLTNAIFMNVLTASVFDCGGAPIILCYQKYK